MKDARIITTRKSQHNGTMKLKAGTEGTGKTLFEVSIWPDSGSSVEAATTMMYERAEQLGYNIVQAEAE